MVDSFNRIHIDVTAPYRRNLESNSQLQRVEPPLYPKTLVATQLVIILNNPHLWNRQVFNRVYRIPRLTPFNLVDRFLTYLNSFCYGALIDV